MTETPIPADVPLSSAAGSWRRAWSVLSEPPVHTVVVWVAAVAVPVAAAGALVPVRTEVPNATMALGLAVLVTLLAAIGTRASAAAAALSAGLSFDVFLTRPYDSFAIDRAADVEITALLLAVGLVAGQLAARTRHHRRRAEDASYDLGRLHAVSEMVALGEPTDQVVIAVANELTDLLGLRACRFEETFAEGPTPFVERQGSITWGALRWGFRTMGLPAREITLVVQHQGLPLGRYVLMPTPGRRVTADELLVAVALADQAGAAIAARTRPI
jgi:hypothetical protein